MSYRSPRIIVSNSAPAGSRIDRCTVTLEYGEGRRARIEFDVHDARTRGDANEAWMEELRRVADALQIAAR